CDIGITAAAWPPHSRLQPSPKSRCHHNSLRHRELITRPALVFPIQIPRGVDLLFVRRFGEIELAYIADVSLLLAQRQAERAADQRTRFVDHAFAGIRETRTRDR